MNASNAGHEGAVVIGKVRESKDSSFGFNAETEDYANMISAGIIDPAKVTRSALQNAGSIAALIAHHESSDCGDSGARQIEFSVAIRVIERQSRQPSVVVLHRGWSSHHTFRRSLSMPSRQRFGSDDGGELIKEFPTDSIAFALAANRRRWSSLKRIRRLPICSRRTRFSSINNG